MAARNRTGSRGERGGEYGEDGMHAPASTWSSYTLLCVELTTVALLPHSPSTQTYTHLTLAILLESKCLELL